MSNTGELCASSSGHVENAKRLPADDATSSSNERETWRRSATTRYGEFASYETTKAIELRVYLDTNVLIEAVEGRSEPAGRFASMFFTPAGAQPRFITSELAIAELLVKPMQLGRGDLLEAYEELMRSDDLLEVVPIDRLVLKGAALLRSHDLRLKLMDAIHLATCLRARCPCFLTNDRRIRTTQEIEVIRLGSVGLRWLQDAFAGD